MGEELKVGDKIIVTTDLYAVGYDCRRNTELFVTKLTDGGVWAAHIVADWVSEYCLTHGEYRKLDKDHQKDKAAWAEIAVRLRMVDVTMNYIGANLK